MKRVAIRGLLARKLRSTLTAIAIVLGVAMVSGTLVLTDTIDKAFDTIFSSSYEQTDAVVSGKKLVEWSQTGKAQVSPEVLATVRALPEVEAAAGTILDLSGDANQAKILDKNGKAIQGNNPTFGLGIDPADERFNPFKLVEGDWATGPRQVVVDLNTADEQGFKVGDTVKVAGDGPVRAFTLTGIARFGDVNSLGGATIALFDVETARSVLRKTGFDAVAVAARDGVAQEKLIDSIQRALPATAEVRTGAEQAAEDGEGVGEFVTFIRYFLLAFGGIALFVGAFVIFNTLSITVAQRTKELATLRTLGASRRQVLRSVVLEGLVLGVVASAIGLGLGVLLAKGLTALFRAVDLEMPQAAMVFQTRTAVVAMLTGTLVTLVASVWPAVRATRIAPISAVREGGMVVKRPSRKTLVFGLAVTALSTFGLVYGTLGEGVSTGGTGARDRRRRVRPLHRARCDRTAPRSPARARRRPAGRPPRRRRRAPGAGERGAQSGPDGLDRSRADDRVDAGLVRRGLRQGPARKRRDRAPQAAGYEPRDHLAERLGHRSPRCRQGCERGPGRRARLVDPQRPCAARRRRRSRRQRGRPGDDRACLQLRMGRRLCGVAGDAGAWRRRRPRGRGSRRRDGWRS